MLLTWHVSHSTTNTTASCRILGCTCWAAEHIMYLQIFVKFGSNWFIVWPDTDQNFSWNKPAEHPCHQRHLVPVDVDTRSQVHIAIIYYISKPSHCLIVSAWKNMWSTEWPVAAGSLDAICARTTATSLGILSTLRWKEFKLHSSPSILQMSSSSPIVPKNLGYGIRYSSWSFGRGHLSYEATCLEHTSNHLKW